MMVLERPGNILLNAVLQSLGCTSYVPTVAVSLYTIGSLLVHFDDSSQGVSDEKPSRNEHAF